MQQGYRRDTSQEVQQDHIAKCEKLKQQEYIFTGIYLIATGKYNDAMACLTLKNITQQHRALKTKPKQYNSDNILEEKVLFGCHGNQQKNYKKKLLIFFNQNNLDIMFFPMKPKFDRLHALINSVLRVKQEDLVLISTKNHTKQPIFIKGYPFFTAFLLQILHSDHVTHFESSLIFFNNLVDSYSASFTGSNQIIRVRHDSYNSFLASRQ